MPVVPMLLFWCAVGSLEHDPRLYEIVKDAQAANAAHWQRGVMTVHTSLALGTSKPIEVEATVAWKGQDAFWSYRASDPDAILMRDYHSAGLDQAKTEYRLFLGDRLYVYNPFTNVLLLHALRTQGDLNSAREFLDVLPTALWSRCCPPRPSEGRPWLELIGPNPRGLRPGSKLSIAKLDDDTIKQTRRDPDGGVSELTFSLASGGNVTSYRYIGTNPLAGSQSGTYLWGKGPKGAFVLKRCEFRKSAIPHPKGQLNPELVYTVTMKSIDLGAAVDASRLSFDVLKTYLPKNTRVYDNIADSQYPLFKNNLQLDRDLAPLRDEVRSRGFLKKVR